VLETELTEIRDKYGDERKTEIEDVWEDIDDEDLIAEEDCVFTLTHNGYIKRLETTEYNAQRRGGKGVRAMATREEDYVETVFTASTHDNILFFTNLGKVYMKKGYKIPKAERSARGSNIVNILPLEPGEKIATMIHGRAIDEGNFIIMITKNGTVKRMYQQKR
jgi:DNA gyrase subunit A